MIYFAAITLFRKLLKYFITTFGNNFFFYKLQQAFIATKNFVTINLFLVVNY